MTGSTPIEQSCLTSSTAVAFNRTVAVAETAGPEVGLEAIEDLELDSNPCLHSARADFLCRFGLTAEARAAYERALELAYSETDRRLLARRLAE